jgi:hypothetical protein
MGLGRLELPTFYEAWKVKFFVTGHTDPGGLLKIVLPVPFPLLVRRLRVAASRVSWPSHYLLSVSARSVWPSTIFRVRSRATQGAWWGRLHLTLGRGDFPRDPVGLRHAPDPYLLFPVFLLAGVGSDLGNGSLR